MEIEHIQKLTEDLTGDLSYKFDTLMEIAEHFRIDYREDMKKSLEGDLRKKLKDLISEFESKLEKLKYTVATLKSSY